MRGLTTLTHLISACLAGLLVWYFQAARLGADLSDAKLHIAEIAAARAQEQRAKDHQTYMTARAISLNYEGAINEKTKQLSKLNTIVANSSRNLERLRDQLNAADVRIQSATESTLRDYATAANRVLAECGQRYRAVAENADGHAIDAAACRAAWPVTTK